MLEINWVGAIVAGIAGFVLGGLWYSPLLFSKRWQAETGVGKTVPIRYPFAVPMIASVTISIIGAIALSALVGPAPSFKGAIVVGAVIGFLCVAPAIKMNGLFGQNSPGLIAIHALYPASQFTLMGAILGLWSSF
ncbi:hypothetical protein sos41_09150 [Alphaproteobacteria bacterium SO-S41]|nr:hypothetical protein sos41_09150 [Alphaproteobacteria bacterium SO-S41]